MELMVLGCHAGMPTDGLASSGYLVSTEACRILLDCGPGVATALSARGGAGKISGSESARSLAEGKLAG